MVSKVGFSSSTTETDQLRLIHVVVNSYILSDQRSSIDANWLIWTSWHML
jgi:hypothetical protein